MSSWVICFPIDSSGSSSCYSQYQPRSFLPFFILWQAAYVGVDIVWVNPVAADAVGKINAGLMKPDDSLRGDVYVSLLVIICDRFAAD